jgi:hypothetical protein
MISSPGVANASTLVAQASAAVPPTTILSPPTPSSASDAEPGTGETASFWALDEASTPATPIQVQAVVRYVGENCVIYVDQRSPVNQTVLNDLGSAFDETIFPRLTGVLGSVPTPGIDGTSKITILVYDFGDRTVSGLFRPSDIAPGQEDAHSNRREMIYLNSTSVSADPDSGPVLSAHELAHLIVYYQDFMLDPYPGRVAEAAWIDEGIACFAEHLAGYDGRTTTFLMSFANDPDTNLTSDFTLGKNYLANYGASYSFISYLVGREGQDFLTALVAEHTDGIAGINAVLQARGSDDSFDYLLNDWWSPGSWMGGPPRRRSSPSQISRYRHIPWPKPDRTRG